MATHNESVESSTPTKVYSLIQSIPKMITSSSFKFYSTICLGTSICIVGWEDIARRNNSQIKPSVALQSLNNKLKILFICIGSTYARLNSYLIKLDLSSLRLTFNDLGNQIINFCGSPLNLVRGYSETMNTYGTKKGLITIGSLISTMTAILIIHKCRKNNINLWNMINTFKKNKFSLFNNN